MSYQPTLPFLERQLQHAEVYRLNKELRQSGRRLCSGCWQTMALSKFYSHLQKGALRYACYCKKCEYAKVKKDGVPQKRADWHRQYLRTPRGIASKLFMTARCRARYKKLPFDLDLADIQSRIIHGHCEISGLPFVFELRSPWLPSLDQRLPQGGYTQANTVVVVKLLNFAKNAYAIDDVLRLSKALMEKFPF